uniref:Uncharacterized protein n=1 Tax=Rhizophora mucronata TaxID=61149 RepID=A0A2P2KAF4_RHIMU
MDVGRAAAGVLNLPQVNKIIIAIIRKPQLQDLPPHMLRQRSFLRPAKLAQKAMTNLILAVNIISRISEDGILVVVEGGGVTIGEGEGVVVDSDKYSVAAGRSVANGIGGIAGH